MTADLAASEKAAMELRALYGRNNSRELRRRVKDDLADGSIEREIKDAELWRELLAVSATGSRLFGPTLLEASLGYTTAGEREPDRVDTSFVQEEVELGPDARPVNEDPASSCSTRSAWRITAPASGTCSPPSI